MVQLSLLQAAETKTLKIELGEDRSTGESVEALKRVASSGQVWQWGIGRWFPVVSTVVGMVLSQRQRQMRSLIRRIAYAEKCICDWSFCPSRDTHSE